MYVHLTERTVVTKEEVLKNYRVSEILEAARRTIGRFGFEGTTIDRVAEEALALPRGTLEGLRERSRPDIFEGCGFHDYR